MPKPWKGINTKRPLRAPSGKPYKCDDCPCEDDELPDDGGGGVDPTDCGGCTGGVDGVPNSWILDTTGSGWTANDYGDYCDCLFRGVWEVPFVGGVDGVCNWELLIPPYNCPEPAESGACVPFDSPINFMKIYVQTFDGGLIRVMMAPSFVNPLINAVRWEATQEPTPDCTVPHSLTMTEFGTGACCNSPAFAEPTAFGATLTPVFA